MTRKSQSTVSARKPRAGARAKPLPGRWRLQDAKARFSELVRKVRSEGPQHVTVHGREAVVVIAAEDFHRLQDQRTGADLIAAMQACPDPDFEMEHWRGPMPVRPVEL
jgi:prevent-host-death family protein